jgi:hypothetical protein
MSTFDSLPKDIRHTLACDGLNYRPLRDRLARLGDASSNPHAATCACKVCELIRDYDKRNPRDAFESSQN